MLEIVIISVERYKEYLALLGVDVDLRVELFQHADEGLAGGAPLCTEKDREVLVCAFKLIRGAFVHRTECLTIFF